MPMGGVVTKRWPARRSRRVSLPTDCVALILSFSVSGRHRDSDLEGSATPLAVCRQWRSAGERARVWLHLSLAAPSRARAIRAIQRFQGAKQIILDLTTVEDVSVAEAILTSRPAHLTSPPNICFIYHGQQAIMEPNVRRLAYRAVATRQSNVTFATGTFRRVCLDRCFECARLCLPFICACHCRRCRVYPTLCIHCARATCCPVCRNERYGACECFCETIRRTTGLI